MSALEEAPPPEAPPVAELYQLPPMTEAEALDIIAWHNRHLREAETIRANAERMIRAEEDAARRVLEYHGARLREWLRSRLTGKRRSLRTLRGVLGFRWAPARAQCTDKAALLEYARRHRPEAITGVELGKVAAVKGGVLVDPETGEMLEHLPGVELTEARELFFVRPGVTGTDRSEETEGEDE